MFEKVNVCDEVKLFTKLKREEVSLYFFSNICTAFFSKVDQYLLALLPFATEQCASLSLSQTSERQSLGYIFQKDSVFCSFWQDFLGEC